MKNLKKNKEQQGALQPFLQDHYMGLGQTCQSWSGVKLSKAEAVKKEKCRVI